MKYALCIDYKAATNKGLNYMTMEAKNELEAMAEADSKWNDELYMMQIMKQDGKIERTNGYKIAKYVAILARRSFGWHLNNEQNAEAPHSVNHYIPNNREYDWFATV